jgi:hypothetical protein
MKKFLLSLCAMLAMTSSAFADDTFSVDAVTLPINAKADLVVNYSLDEGSYSKGYSFTLTLPSQLEFDTYESGGVLKVVYTSGDCYSEGVASIITNLDGNVLKVAYVNMSGEPLTKQSGTLVTFKVKVKEGETVAVGDVLNASLTEGIISNPGGEVHSVADSDFTITIDAEADLHTILDELSTEAPEATTEAVDVRVKRTFVADQWSTICLPFPMTAEQLADAFGTVVLADFTGYDTTEDGDNVIQIVANFSSVTALEANHPYLIKVSNATDYENGFTVDGVIVNPSDELEINFGTNRKPKAIVGTYVAETVVPEECLFLSDDLFWYSAGDTTMKAFRAYFDFYDVVEVAAEESAPVVINLDGQLTRIDQLNIDNNDDNYYTLDGRAVKTPGKGVYIHNGKKVVIK